MKRRPVFGPGGLLPCKPGDHDPARGVPLEAYRGAQLTKFPCGEVVCDVAPHDWWVDEAMAREFLDMWYGARMRLPRFQPLGGWPEAPS